MPKLRVLSGAEVCAILIAHGFVEVRRRGSHVMMQRNLHGEVTSVPVPAHREMRAGTLAAIIRQSGVDRAAFEVS